MSKRIAIISSSCPPVSAGGVASAHYHLFRALIRRGFEVRLFTFEDYNVALNEDAVVRVGMAPWLSRLLRRGISMAFRFIDPGRVAYNLADVAVSVIPCLMLNRAISAFRPDVMILPDHGCPGLAIRTPGHCRTLLIAHHNPNRFLNNPLWGLHSDLDARWTVALENKVLRGVDAVVCPSGHMLEMFKKTYEYAGPVTVIPNMADLEFIAALGSHDVRPALGLQPDALMIYIPSAGSPYKGSRYVSEIIRRLAASSTEEIGFYLSGPIDRSLEYELRTISHNAKIYTPSQMPYETNLGLVKTCSFGISPTLIENFGMAILEANCCGLPMVSFDVGGNGDVIANGRNGVLVPALDVEALIKAACRLMDPSYRIRLRDETVRLVAERFGGDGIVDAMINLMSPDDKRRPVYEISHPQHRLS